MCSSPSCQNNPLDTIAQLETNKYRNNQKKELNPIQKRARSKYLSLSLVGELYSLNSPLKSSYGRSLACCNTVEVEDGIAKSQYCKNRWCLVCSRIKTAVSIQKYKKSLDDEITNPYFVTLTIPNIPANFLEPKLKEMMDELKKIVWKRNKQFQRQIAKEGEKGYIPKLKCVAKYECTYNSIRHDFHPHIHIIVSSKESAKFLVNEWFLRFPKASTKAQDFRQADEDSKLELFKYTAKLMSQIEDFEKGKKEVGKIYVEALDIIYRAFRKKRTLRAYGFKLDIAETFEDDELEAVTEVDAGDGVYIYNKQASDWINTRTGEFLAMWILTSREKYFKKSIISDTGKTFITKKLNSDDLEALIDGYRFKPRFKGKFKDKYSLVTMLDQCKSEMFTFECELWDQVKALGFDDSEGEFVVKLKREMENFR